MYPAYHFSSRPNRDFPYDNKCFSNPEFVSVSVFVSVLGWAGTFHMGFGRSISFRMGFGGESILSVVALMWCRLCALLNVGFVMRSCLLREEKFQVAKMCDRRGESIPRRPDGPPTRYPLCHAASMTNEACWRTEFSSVVV